MVQPVAQIISSKRGKKSDKILTPTKLRCTKLRIALPFRSEEGTRTVNFWLGTVESPNVGL